MGVRLVHIYRLPYAVPVDLYFETELLRECFDDAQAAGRRWPSAVAVRYVLILNVVLAAERIEDLETFRSLAIRSTPGSARLTADLADGWQVVLEHRDASVGVREVCRAE